MATIKCCSEFYFNLLLGIVHHVILPLLRLGIRGGEETLAGDEDNDEFADHRATEMSSYSFNDFILFSDIEGDET